MESQWNKFYMGDDGTPQDKVYFDELQLELVEQSTIVPQRSTGGTAVAVVIPNRF